MRIGINAQILTDGRTGVTRFARNIIRALPTAGCGHEFILFGSPNDITVEQRNVKLVPTGSVINSTVKRILWEQLVLPRLVVSHKIDTMYYPDFAAAFLEKATRSVVTFHDITPFAVPLAFGRIRGKYKRFAMRNSSRFAAAIVTGSESTKREILKYLSVEPEKIRVVPYGTDSFMAREEQTERLEKILTRYRINRPIILSVGTLEVRKNIVGLLKAFAHGKRQYRWPHTLVLVGSPGYGYDTITKTMHKERIEDSVVVTGYVQDEELPAMYTLADVFVYPSFYEGFGFPPLEAMKCRCPVIASRATSLPEIVGDAGVFIDPHQPEEISEAINTVLSDKILREGLQRKGNERARMFTWEKTAQGILDVITSL